MERFLQEPTPQDMFDDEMLFDAAGHLTNEGLQALQDGRLDELGSLEAAEHLTFCDFCLARYTDLIEAMPEKLQAPMRDLIPQVQALMRLRTFRIMTNRYISVAAAMVLALALWSFGAFGGVPTADKKYSALPQPTQPSFSISQSINGALSAASNGLSGLLGSVQSTARDGLAQLTDPSSILKNGGAAPAKGE